MTDITTHHDYLFCSESPLSKWRSWLACCLVVQDALVWVPKSQHCNASKLQVKLIKTKLLGGKETHA